MEPVLKLFWLAQHGYEVVGSDINAKMLKIGRSKAKKQKRTIKFINGDMRTAELGIFDAVTFDIQRCWTSYKA